MNKDELYQSLILKNQSSLPFFSNGHSNHFSMSLWSLKGLNAPIEVIKFHGSLERWDKSLARFNTTFLPVPISKGRITKHNSLNHFGDIDYYPDYLDFLRQEDLANNPILFNQLYHKLVESLDSALFHPFIRFSIGCQDNNNSEQLISLAYWIATFSENTEPSQTGFIEPLENEMEKIISYFSETGDFIALHYITSYSAMINLPDSLKVITRKKYHSIVTNFTKSIKHSSPNNVDEDIDASLIDEAKNIAFKSYDEHLIKIVYALIQISEVTSLKGLGNALKKAIE